MCSMKRFAFYTEPSLRNCPEYMDPLTSPSSYKILNNHWRSSISETSFELKFLMILYEKKFI